MTFSFPKSRRLLMPHHFRRVMQQGTIVTGTYLSVQICENKNVSKLGITVSRKYGKSTERNRFKRLVREAFRLSQHRLPLLHINVRPQKNALNLTLADIQQELLSLCLNKQRPV